MTLRTPLCDLLNVDYPIMLAGMGGVSYANVCAAVSEAGGFGTLGMAGVRPKEIREQMRQVKDQTDKPFGVDLLAAVPETLDASVDIIIEEGAKAFISGLGVPFNIMQRLQSENILVMNMCGTVGHAVKGAEAGVDAVIAQGTEAGGHTGKVAGMALIPQIVDAVDVPVIAAGSIVDGRGLAVALAFGAVGVWMGTRFIASIEANAADAYKQSIVDAAETDTIVSRCYSGKTMRVRTNDYVSDWESRANEIKRFPAQAQISQQAGVMTALGGQTSGVDPERDALPMGQGAGAIQEVLPCAEIVKNTLAEAEDVIASLSGLVRN